MIDITTNCTPQDFFTRASGACQTAQRYCHEFPTMQAAWLSRTVDPSHMVWLVGCKIDFQDRLLKIGEWLLTTELTEEARRYVHGARNRTFVSYGFSYNAHLYSESRASAYSWLVGAGNRYAGSVKLIRETFPEVFNTEAVC